jgi:hypothetical protein
MQWTLLNLLWKICHWKLSCFSILTSCYHNKIDTVGTNEVGTTLLAIPMQNSTQADCHAACQGVLCCLWNFADVSKLLETT